MKNIKVYTFLTESHKVFLNHFVNSFPFEDGFDLEIKYFPQECPSAKYREEGWKKTMTKKIEYILYSLNNLENGDYFIHSDIDVQFFGNIKNDLNGLISEKKDVDIFFQNDYVALCMGFFLCKKNSRVVHFFKNVLKQMDNFLDDQRAVNEMIGKYPIKAEMLPDRYYTVGVRNGKWDGKKTNLYVPDDILMHHANWTEGIENKINLITLVKKIVDDRKLRIQIS